MSQVKLNTKKLFLIPKKSIKPKRVDTGLYHGKRIGTGHYRSFSERKFEIFSYACWVVTFLRVEHNVHLCLMCIT